MKPAVLIGICTILLIVGCSADQGVEPAPTEPAISCGIENCHGLDVQCGPNVAVFCTQEYQLGDFCRNFAKCVVEDGACVLEQNQRFLECRACIEQCIGLDSTESFKCEATCRDSVQ